MAERKRGLGRGIGSLIPDVINEDRPVDVFFPQSNRNVSRETSKDPAESMRKSRASKNPLPRKTDEEKATPSKSAAEKKKTAATKASPTRKTATKKASNDDVSRETELVEVPGTAFGMLKIDTITANPRQPRTVFDEDDLDELVTSIQEVGVLQPVVVRVIDTKKPAYELVMGERRLRASKLAGLDEIPAIVREVRDDDLLRDALLENLHRSDLNPLEEAAAYQQLLDDFKCTQEELSERIGRSRPQIANTLRLLRLPSLVQRRVAAGVLSQGHARALLALDEPSHMEELAQRIVAEGLSVRATEEAVILLNRGDQKNVSRETRKADPELVSLAQTVGDKLDTKVNIVMGKRKGKITVDFANQQDLERILKVLGLNE